MNRLQRTEAFAVELSKFIDKSIRELELSWAEIIGALTIKLHELILRSLKK